MVMDRVTQAGAIVFRADRGRPQILLVRPKRGPEWIFPKGHVDPGETLEAAALREAREEAGVVGRSLAMLSPPLEFLSKKEPVRVTYFLVIATGAVRPEEQREQRWLPPDEALAAITHEDARKLLAAALPTIEQACGG